MHKNFNAHLRETLDEMEEDFARQLEVSVVSMFHSQLAEVSKIFEESLRETELEY